MCFETFKYPCGQALENLCLEIASEGRYVYQKHIKNSSKMNTKFDKGRQDMNRREKQVLQLVFGSKLFH